jgi:hypothetical protein
MSFRTSAASRGSRLSCPLADSSNVKDSAGQRDGTAGAKIGHADLQWACSEAAVLVWRNNPAGQNYLARLENPHGQGTALPV